MSLLKYLSRVDPRYRDSQLPDPNGPLARAVPSSAISVANESVNVSLESNKKAAKRGVYQKLSAEKKAEIGKRAAVCGHGSTAYAHAYTMKHTVGVAVWRGLAVGQMEPRNLFNENFVDSYPRNLSSAKLRRYTV